VTFQVARIEGFDVVVPQVVEALAERVGAPVGTWRA